ncbi:MAG: hypothetical protein JXX14_09485, partial [Deltaproteobacteria bacterium]|nr:hypothetical protein [Deltaproteobacteria bacterium]
RCYCWMPAFAGMTIYLREHDDISSLLYRDLSAFQTRSASPVLKHPNRCEVIASPYTWLEEYTKKQNWLGGFKKDGEPVTGLDGLHQYLAPAFEPVGEPVDVPFVIRETARKFQHTISQVTIWRKKPF